MDENQIPVREIRKYNCPKNDNCRFVGEAEYSDYCKNKGSDCAWYQISRRVENSRLAREAMK